jgi:hypothetical protein
MSNSKRNPNIKQYGFKTDREESLTAKLSIIITLLMLDQLKKKDNWQELVRNAVSEKLQ